MAELCYSMSLDRHSSRETPINEYQWMIGHSFRGHGTLPVVDSETICRGVQNFAPADVA
jgi:hypothetical protein